MKLPLNVDVRGSDGRLGRSTYIIINPASEQVTHIVVRGRRPAAIERLVPLSAIAGSSAAAITLNCTQAEFAAFEPFNQTDFVLTDVPHHATDPRLTLLWPYVVPARRIVDTTLKQIPYGELALHRWAWVKAHNGRRLGRVDEFIVDPDSGNITHLVLREGHVWGRRVITIPLSLIERIVESTVFVSGDRQSIAQMPAVKVKRGW